jgi:hypothetical protein
MIDRLKRLTRNHPILAYMLAILCIIGIFVCMAYLMYIDSDKTSWLAFPTIFVAWLIAACEQIREDEERKREAYLRIIRRINRLD